MAPVSTESSRSTFVALYPLDIFVAILGFAFYYHNARVARLKVSVQRSFFRLSYYIFTTVAISDMMNPYPS
eukprot:CAMPEP_0172515360 /NCGR_PEP_ID=MMETSP1066-20121228/267481_1 /TAXON_ID=671091 /ORGANISM="Coscinodiscus wailesii, Strain CCMP2513" /LENGTH=70 /DNA_ID=CAMNT_0013296399 /DNA_START=93 /DNA_END=302 /DNA_ORIENTATION=+